MRVQVPFYIILFFLPSLLSYQTIPQTYIPEKIQFKRLTLQDGFPARNISYMLQDSKGFLWLATPDGLIRFDGKKQKLFRYSPTDENSIGSNTVVFIYEDKSGILWFATPGGGLNKYNSSEENFTRYTHNPSDPASISSNEVYSILEDKEGIFWIGTYRGGLNKFDPKSGKFSSYKNDASNINSLSNNNVSEVYEDSKGNLWIGTRGGGLNRFDREKQKFIRFVHSETEFSSLSNNNVTGILEDINGSLWISTMGGGLNKLSFKSGQQNPVFVHYKNNPNNPYSLSSNEVNKLYLDRENVLWVGTWGGGLNKMISPSKENSSVEFISYKHDQLDIFTLTDNNVECIYEDNSGLLWISTSGAALQIYDKNKKPFRLYVSEPNNPNSLGYTAIWSVYEDREGTRWIGLGDGGLNKMIKGTEKFIRYTHNPKDPYSISDNCVSTIYEDKFNNLWVGTWNGGLNKFNRKTGRFYKYKHDPKNPKSISDNRIFTIIEDTSENLWIGTRFGGLNKFNRNDESFTHYRHNPHDPGSLSSDYASELYCDKNGNLLIATFIGLDLFDQKNEKFLHLNLSEKNYPSNKDIRVTAIRESKSGFLWMGIMDLGLIKYDLKEGVKKTYTTEDGLPINYITGILEDDHENLWVSTTIGVSKFNPKTEKFSTYSNEDGLQGMNETKPFKSKTGELIFCGAMGLSIFHPDSIKDNIEIPPVYITDFYLFNKSVPIGFDSVSQRAILRKSIIESEAIELNFDDNVFAFEFAALDYHAPLKNKYAYKMEGFDKDWTYTDAARNLATYTNLDPGEYLFRVKGSNNDGFWNEKGASIKIILLPPWWRTNLAYLIYFLLIVGIIYGTWKAQLRRIRNKHDYEMSRFEAQKLQEVDKMKTRFFTNISHEFRTPLTLILGPSKQLSASSNEEKTKATADLIHRNAKKLNRLVDELLDIAKIETGEMKLKASPLNIVSLTKETALSFYSLAERKKINFNLISEQD
jgi:ligand-binding sensor domain-containing protein